MEIATHIAQGLDIRQTSMYGSFMQTIGWQTLHVEGVQIFLRKLWPGNIAKIQRFDSSIDKEKLMKILRQHRVMMCKIEPGLGVEKEELQRLQEMGFRQDSWPMLGTKTMMVDLQPELSERLKGLGEDTRYKLRKLEKETHAIEINNHDEFYSIFKKAFSVKKIWMPPRNQYDALVRAFGADCFCMTIDRTCGCLVLLNGSLASYFYGATLENAKRQNTPYLLIWEAMKEAKKRGAKVWDFEGIFDPRWPNHAWKGFSYFKERFRGEIVSYPGSFTRWSLRDIFGN